MNDPRLGLPSASSFERLVKCPGSQNLIRTLPPKTEAEEEGDEDAQSGTRIHAALAGDGIIQKQLNPEERETWQTCERLAMELVKHKFGDVTTIVRNEERRWLKSATTLEKLASGQMDREYISDEMALLLEWKTGHKGAPPAAKNWQALVNAVLAANSSDVESVAVAVIQPWVSPQVSVVEYAWEEIRAGEAEIARVLKESQKTDAPRYAGPHCEHCPASKAIICQERIGQLLAVEVMISKEVTSPQQLGTLWGHWKQVEKLGTALKRKLEALSPEDLKLARLKMKDGAKVREIQDPLLAWQQAMPVMGKGEFASCLSLSLGVIETILYEKHKHEKTKKEITAMVNETFAGNIELKQNKPSLAFLKEGE